jgi:glucan biosynthesis protein C
MNTRPARRLDLDWMRVLAILSVFVYHSTRFFNISDWHVKNLTTYPFLENVTRFMDTWMMPFIFVISGASLFYALSKGNGWKTAGAFIKDKVLRLFVPLVINIFSLVILQVYFERVSHGQFHGSLLDFLPHYFEGIYGFGGNFALVGNHLWYLAVLFFFSLLLLPVFMLLKSRIGSRVLGWVTSAVAIPGGIYILALAMITLWKQIDPNGVLGFDKFNWNLGVYMTFLVFGFVLISSEKLQRSLQTLRWPSLAIAIAMTIWFFITSEHDDMVSWSWVLTFLGFGMKCLNINKPVVKYANEAVLPFYILHQTVLLGVGFFVVQWSIPDPLKWAIIAVGSFAIIMGVYEGLVRRSNILRFLFGMKLLKKAPQAQTLPAQPVLRNA